MQGAQDHQVFKERLRKHLQSQGRKSGPSSQMGKCLPWDCCDSTKVLCNPGPGKPIQDQGIDPIMTKSPSTKLQVLQPHRVKDKPWDFGMQLNRINQDKMELTINCIAVKNLCSGNLLTALASVPAQALTIMAL